MRARVRACVCAVPQDKGLLVYVRDGAPTPALQGLMDPKSAPLASSDAGPAGAAVEEKKPAPRKKPAPKPVVPKPAGPRAPSPPRVRQPVVVSEDGWVVVPNK